MADRSGWSVGTSTYWRQHPVTLERICLNAPTGTTPAWAGSTAYAFGRARCPPSKIWVATSGMPQRRLALWLSKRELDPTTAKLVLHAVAVAFA